MAADAPPLSAEWIARWRAAVKEQGLRGVTVGPETMTGLLDLAERALAEARKPASDGAALIAQERERQVSAEGWTADHDDGHDCGELVEAAASYLLGHLARDEGRSAGQRRELHQMESALWPWPSEYHKAAADEVRQLTKIGALIAAEIDRLRRQFTGSVVPDDLAHALGADVGPAPAGRDVAEAKEPR